MRFGRPRHSLGRLAFGAALLCLLPATCLAWWNPAWGLTTTLFNDSNGNIVVGSFAKTPRPFDLIIRTAYRAGAPRGGGALRLT